MQPPEGCSCAPQSGQGQQMDSCSGCRAGDGAKMAPAVTGRTAWATWPCGGNGTAWSLPLAARPLTCACQQERQRGGPDGVTQEKGR